MRNEIIEEENQESENGNDESVHPFELERNKSIEERKEMIKHINVNLKNR